MLDKWKQTALILVGAIFAIAAVWGWTIPVSQDTIQTLVNVLFTILATLGIGVGMTAKIMSKKLKG